MDKFQLVKFTDQDFEINVRTDSENDTVWLTKNQIALLFDRDRTVISRHINNIYKKRIRYPKYMCKKCTYTSNQEQRV